MMDTWCSSFLVVLETTRKEEQLEHAQKLYTKDKSKSDDSTDGRSITLDVINDVKNRCIQVLRTRGLSLYGTGSSPHLVCTNLFTTRNFVSKLAYEIFV
jgi:hypothetical protein